MNSTVKTTVSTAKYDRVKCVECGYTNTVANMQYHRDRTAHYRFRFTRDIEVPARVR